MTLTSDIDFGSALERTRAVSAFRGGDFPRAYRCGRKLLREDRNNSSLMILTGLSAAHTGLLDTGVELLRKALRRRPDDLWLDCEIGRLLAQQGQLDEALRRFDRVLKKRDGFPPAVTGKAHVQQRRGDNEGAIELLTPLVSESRFEPSAVVTWATAHQSLGEFDVTIDPLKKMLADQRIDLVARSRGAALLAKAFEKNEDYASAFNAFEMSNKVIARSFDPASFISELDELIATYSEANLAALPRAANASDAPVFIASLPRSGSTLTEQIIHAHPKGFGAGEIVEIAEIVHDLPAALDSIQPYPACLGDLTQEKVNELGDEYIADLRSYDRSARRIVNKHLENYRNLGLISLIAPRARVIHVKRNPLDNCLSIFMAAMNTNKYGWSTDLAHLGLVYRQYERLMAHWHAVLDMPILDVQYEDLVDDPDMWIRRIIEFIDLEWDDRCLRSHESQRDVMTLSYDQVRRPIYRSAMNRAENYDAHLGPLKQALAQSAGERAA